MSAKLVDIARELIDLIRKDVPDPTVLLDRRTDDLEDEIYALEAALSEAPTDKPLPDAPGWWACQSGKQSDIVRVVARTDGSLRAVLAEDDDSVPLDPKWSGRWYGPIALPWGAK